MRGATQYGVLGPWLEAVTLEASATNGAAVAAAEAPHAAAAATAAAAAAATATTAEDTAEAAGGDVRPSHADLVFGIRTF